MSDGLCRTRTDIAPGRIIPRRSHVAAGGEADMHHDRDRQLVAGLYALWIVVMALIAVAFMMGFSS
jgi:hypothetical protein